MKLEEGGESRAPLAVVIIGGVISSTLLTLVLVPSVYTILDDLKVQFGRLTGVVSRFLPRARPKVAPAWRLAVVPHVIHNGPVATNGHAHVVPESLVRVPSGDRPSPSGRQPDPGRRGACAPPALA